MHLPEQQLLELFADIIKNVTTNIQQEVNSTVVTQITDMAQIAQLQRQDMEQNLVQIVKEMNEEHNASIQDMVQKIQLLEKITIAQESSLHLISKLQLLLFVSIGLNVVVIMFCIFYMF